MGALTAVDLVVVAHACQDYAGRYIGGPLGLGRSDAIRYVAEGHLRELEQRHDFRTLYAAVKGYVDAHPDVLEHRATDAELVERSAAREVAANAVDQLALAAFNAGDYAAALQLLDRAELEAPALCNWDKVRDFVRSKGGETQ